MKGPSLLYKNVIDNYKHLTVIFIVFLISVNITFSEVQDRVMVCIENRCMIRASTNLTELYCQIGIYWIWHVPFRFKFQNVRFQNI